MSDSPVNILVVDDLGAQRLTIEAALGDLGENIVAVSSGRDALKFLLKNEAAVVLLDVNMPGMDGFETAALIRQRPRNANTPIIFLTADHDAMQVARGYALGAVDYLTCPFLPDVLRTKVKVFVTLSRARERVRQEAEQRVAFLHEQAARAAAEEQSRRLRLLSEAGGVMMQTLDGVPFEDELLRLLVPSLADEAGVQFADGESPGTPAVWRRVSERGVEVVAMASWPLADAASQSARTGDAAAIDPDPQGRPRCVVQPIAVPSRIYGAVGLARHGDSTGYSAEERELIRLIAGRAAVAFENRRLYRELQERDRRKDEFLAMLSHELRNPLGAITAAAHVLEVIGGTDAKAVRASQVVKRQSSHLSRIVDDLLEVSRVTVGRITLDRAAIDLREVADRTIESLHAAGALAQHHVEVRGSAVLVDADAARMEQVLTNLVVNAAKYSDSGGHITVEVEGDEQRARVRVTDDGIGIAPELIEHLFDVFVQGGQALDRARGGLGLGLTLVRRLVELQGGSVSAASPGLGKGSTFMIELPRIHADAHTGRIEVRKLAGATPLRVLLVDDNEDARMMLRTYLELRGHRVHEAASGPEAVDAALDLLPDLVLLDLGLPGFDGLEVSRRLRADLRTRDVRLIALTGYGQAEDREKTASLGFQAHLVKPVTPERLDEAFAVAFQRHASPERMATS